MKMPIIVKELIDGAESPGSHAGSIRFGSQHFDESSSIHSGTSNDSRTSRRAHRAQNLMQQQKQTEASLSNLHLE